MFFTRPAPAAPSRPAARFRPQLEALEDRTTPADLTPVVIVPGLGATVPANTGAAPLWLVQLGVRPEFLTYIDNFQLGTSVPSAASQTVSSQTVYQPLINNLIASGYTLNKNLFVAVYDWRLPFAPDDGVADSFMRAGKYGVPGSTDQTVYGTGAADIANGRFKFGIDYLGYWLRQAAEANPNAGSVNIIAHSLGGLVSRAYVQSDAYNGVYDPATGRRLPKVDQLITLGTPQLGAAKAWKPFNNDYSGDTDDYTFLLYLVSFIPNAAYTYVRNVGPIVDYQFKALITEQNDPLVFLRQYISGINNLVPTYAFLDGRTVNGDPAARNSILLDLNGNNDPTLANRFAGLVGHTTAFVGTSLETFVAVDSVVTRDGVPSSRGFVKPFQDLIARVTQPGETWFRPVSRATAGDGTVPTTSLFGFLSFDPTRVTLVVNPTGPVDHVGIVTNASVLAQIRSLLGVTTRRLLAVAAGPGGGPAVKLFDADTREMVKEFFAYPPSFTGGVKVAQGDVTGDGVADIVTAAGAGGGPAVSVFDGVTGDLVRSFFAFDPSFSGGVDLAVADFDGDGFADIAAAAGPGGGPVVSVFSGKDGSLLKSFFAFDPSFAGGVSLAAGDVDRDGVNDLVLGAGPGGGAHVRAVSGKDGSELASFFAFDPIFLGGVKVGAGDLNGDGDAEILAAAGPGGGPHVKVFDEDGDLTDEFFAADPSFTGGIGLAARDTDGDGRDDVVTSPLVGSGGTRTRSGRDGTDLAVFAGFDPSFQGGVDLG